MKKKFFLEKSESNTRPWGIMHSGHTWVFLTWLLNPATWSPRYLFKKIHHTLQQLLLGDSLYFGFDTMISCLGIVQFKQYGWSIGQTKGDTCCYLNKCSQLLKCFRKIIFSCITSWYPSSITARNCRVSLLFFSSRCSESLSNISFLIFFKHPLDQTFEVMRIRKMFRQFDLM